MTNELYREITRNDRLRVKAFEGCAYTADDFQRELEIYERLHKAWGLRFVQSVLAPSSTVWFAHDDAGNVSGAVKADSFEGDISKAEWVTFYWEPVRQAMLAAAAIGVNLRLVAASAKQLYSCRIACSPTAVFVKPPGCRVTADVRLDKGGVAADQMALLLFVPKAEMKLVRER
jgi:hypothetical protein